MRLLLKAIIFFILTILTQVGGIIFLISIYLNHKLFKKKQQYTGIIFILLYVISNQLLIPKIAPVFGRERIINNRNIKCSNFFGEILNRNYVDPKLNILLKDISGNLTSADIQINYLDANFPFFDKFPLIPHLSHNDGKKIDLSLVYEDQNGKISKNIKSRSGYGVFEKPSKLERNQTTICKNLGYWQYDYPKYLTFGKINNQLKFSKIGTKLLINNILLSPNVEKIFIEPHLKTRMGLNKSRIRLHGCGAVRHDDHIHVQIK